MELFKLPKLVQCIQIVQNNDLNLKYLNILIDQKVLRVVKKTITGVNRKWYHWEATGEGLPLF